MLYPSVKKSQKKKVILNTLWNSIQLNGDNIESPHQEYKASVFTMIQVSYGMVMIYFS